MPTDVPDKLKGRERLLFVRKCLTAPKQKFFYKDGNNRKTDDGTIIGGMFMTADEAKADSVIKAMPGKQNKRHGRQPGSYKHKRDIIRKSRRQNRS